MRLWKPTPEECRTLRYCAERSAGARNVIMRPGSRYYTGKDADHIARTIDLANRPGGAFNLLFITKEEAPDQIPDDTDLDDNCAGFAEFRKGVLLTEDGRALVDFYVYSRKGVGRDYDEELETNVQAHVENGRMVRVTGTGDGIMWKADQ